MGRNYSLDLRVGAPAFVDGDLPRRTASRHFGVSGSCAIQRMKRGAGPGVQASWTYI